MAKLRKHGDKRGWAILTAVAILKPPMIVLWSRDFVDAKKIPASGGCVVALNHVSHLDPLTSAHLVYNAGRIPRYLAKDGLFRNRVLGGFLGAAGQIPVHRMTSNALDAFSSAVQAVERGECVVVYPEGTITRDPDGWPMRGKSGAARIALETGCPVIPVGQWGMQEVLAPYARRPHFFPRRTAHAKVGDPVDLSDLLGKEPTPAVVAEANSRIMAAITSLVEDLRGSTAPPERFDPRAAGVAETGNPKRKDTK